MKAADSLTEVQNMKEELETVLREKVCSSKSGPFIDAKFSL